MRRPRSFCASHQGGRCRTNLGGVNTTIVQGRNPPRRPGMRNPPATTSSWRGVALLIGGVVVLFAISKTRAPRFEPGPTVHSLPIQPTESPASQVAHAASQPAASQPAASKPADTHHHHHHHYTQQTSKGSTSSSAGGLNGKYEVRAFAVSLPCTRCCTCYPCCMTHVLNGSLHALSWQRHACIDSLTA